MPSSPLGTISPFLTEFVSPAVQKTFVIPSSLVCFSSLSMNTLELLFKCKSVRPEFFSNRHLLFPEHLSIPRA